MKTRILRPYGKHCNEGRVGSPEGAGGSHVNEEVALTYGSRKSRGLRPEAGSHAAGCFWG